MLTATSANISWSQHEFSSPNFTVVLTAVTSGIAGCVPITMTRTVNVTGTSMQFSSLEEFHTYMVSVTATFDGSTNTTGQMTFTTLSKGV